MGFWGKVFGSGPPDAKPASPRDFFAAEVEAAIREAFPAASVQRDPDAFGFLVKRGEKTQTVFLDNAFAETRDMSPEQRRQRIARFVRSMNAPDATAMTWEEVRPKLAPLLRTTSLFSSVPAIARDKQPLRRPVAPFLIECVGVDSDDGIAYCAPHMFSRWGVTAADVFATSTENARRYFTDDVAPFDPQAPYPLWHVARDDSYETSRLLVPGWLASFSGKVEGRPIAIAPERSTLIVGGDGDERCLRRLAVSAKAEFQASPRRISPAVYTIDDTGTVVPLVLATGHPLAAEVALGHLMMAIGEYEAQQQPLQQRLGDDVFVASLKGLKREDGTVFSYTTWTKGALSLLPKADQVAFVVDAQDKESGIFRLGWQALMDIAGPCLLEEPDLDPPRWRTKEWPNGEVLAKLRAAAGALTAASGRPSPD